VTCPDFGFTRRHFLSASAAFAAGTAGFALSPQPAWSKDDDINIVGPKPGYSPQIGTLVSMLTWMRTTVLHSVKGMSQKDLDYLFDPNANTIGAMLLHLAATETYYQMNTIDAKAWGSWPDAVKQKWDVPMELGEPARKAIKGNNLDYYLDILGETREHSLAEYRKRDDAWLMAVDQKWPWGPDEQLLQVVPRMRTRVEPQWADQVFGEAVARGEAEQRIADSFAAPKC
jgi:Protein of unknown function (DUF664)